MTDQSTNNYLFFSCQSTDADMIQSFNSSDEWKCMQRDYTRGKKGYRSIYSLRIWNSFRRLISMYVHVDVQSAALFDIKDMQSPRSRSFGFLLFAVYVFQRTGRHTRRPKCCFLRKDFLCYYEAVISSWCRIVVYAACTVQSGLVDLYCTMHLASVFPRMQSGNRIFLLSLINHICQSTG